MAEHTVQVDHAAIDALFAHYENVEPPKSGEYIPHGEQPEQSEHDDPNAWQDEADALAYLLFGKVAENWEVPDKKVQKFADALARVANKVLPGGLVNVDDWGPWQQLAYAAGACAMCGIDWKTFTLKPLSAEPDDAAADDDQVQSSSSGKYTTTG